VAGSEVGDVPGRLTVGEEGETTAGGKIYEAGTNQEQLQGLFNHPTCSIQTVRLF